ncbi:hypothetical protein D3C78_1976490 [compost metagenome]
MRVIAVDDVLDHRQADALPRMLAIQPLTALQNPLALIRRHPWPIILDAQHQVPRRFLQAHPHLPQA